MAAELNFRIQGTLTHGTGATAVSDTYGNLSFTLNQTTADLYVKVLSVTTSGVSLASGLASNGYALFINLDATNFVNIGEYSSTTLHSCIQLDALSVALLPLDPTKTIRLQADTATCNVATRVWSR